MMMVISFIVHDEQRFQSTKKRSYDRFFMLRGQQLEESFLV